MTIAPVIAMVAPIRVDLRWGCNRPTSASAATEQMVGEQETMFLVAKSLHANTQVA